MSKLVFGQTPPEDQVIVVRQFTRSSCEMPHFTRSGDPRLVPGLVYRKGSVTRVLCAMHGKAEFGI